MQKSQYTESHIRSLLNKHICKVVFEKKNKTKREMICTSNWKWLKRDDVRDFIGFYPPSGKNKKEWKEGQICVFDLDLQDWRSFYVDKVECIEIYQKIYEQ